MNLSVSASLNDSPRASGISTALYLHIAVDVPSADFFDYAPLPDSVDLNSLIGQRVLVPWRRGRAIGIVWRIGPSELPATRIKPILAVLDELPRFDATWRAMVEFAARYYQRGIGETAFQTLPRVIRSADAYKKPISRPRSATATKGKKIVEPSRWSAIAVRRALQKLGEPLVPASIAAASNDGEHSAGSIAATSDEADSAATNVSGARRAGWELNEEQQAAVEAIAAYTTTRSPNHEPSAEGAIASKPKLLFGITGSGKTEVYLRAAQRVLDRGGQVLILVPEINLTPQACARFAQRFPNRHVVALHSQLSDGERLRAWIAAAAGRADIVLGTRLATFVPMPRLALIAVDEEHDASYKQQEGLRYSARDLAIWRAHRLDIPIVLGSATPSLETWANANAGRYERIVLTQRARRAAALPSVQLIDMRSETVQHGLAHSVERALHDSFERGEQSLVFLNRRGYAPVLACAACGWVASCAHCSAHVVFHKATHRMHCHHCGDVQRVPHACPTCGNQDLAPLGRGTQRIEEALLQGLPKARLLRIDADAIRRKGSAEALFERVHAGDADIVIGTQMIAKGHDFERVGLVVVLGADAALYSHDFRAPERLFQQLMQVAGRSGRASVSGRVLVQTRYPNHPLFASLLNHDYARFANAELEQREQARLPPYSYQAVLRAESEELKLALDFLRDARAAALDLAHPHMRIYDAVPMTLVKRAGVERAQLLVESDTRTALQAFLHAWLGIVQPRSIGREQSGVHWHIEVDPLEI